MVSVRGEWSYGVSEECLWDGAAADGWIMRYSNSRTSSGCDEVTLDASLDEERSEEKTARRTKPVRPPRPLISLGNGTKKQTGLA